MDAVFIPADCVFEGEVSSLTASGSIQIEGNWTPKTLISRSGGVVLKGNTLELLRIEAPLGAVEVAAEKASIETLISASASLQGGDWQLGRVEVAGSFEVQAGHLRLEELSGDEVRLTATEMTGSELESRGDMVLTGKAKFEEIRAKNLLISGEFECSKVIVAEKVHVIAGRLAIRFLDCPQFDAERGVQGIVMVATGEILNAAGVRGFIRPQEIDMLSMGSPLDLGTSRVNTADLEALEKKQARQEPVSPIPVSGPTPEQEPAIRSSPAFENETRKESSALADEQLGEVLDAQEADVWAEAAPLPEPLAGSEPSASPTQLLDEPAPEEEDSWQSNLSESSQAEEELNSGDLRASTPLGLDEVFEADSGLLVAPSDTDFSSLTETVAELPLSPPFDADFRDSEPAVEESAVPEDGIELSSSPSNLLESELGDELEEELDEALSLGSHPSKSSSSDEEVTTADLVDEPEYRSDWELGEPSVEEEWLKATAKSDDSTNEAESQPLVPLADDSESLLSSADLDEYRSVDLDMAGEEGALGNFDGLDVEPESREKEQDPGIESLISWRNTPDDVDISLSSSDFEAISHIADESQPSSLPSAQFLTSPEMEEVVPAETSLKDLKGKLNDVLERIRTFFPDDNYPKFIVQIQHYVDDERFHILNKARNREAVLASFDKLDHPEIANLALEFYAALDDHFGELA